MDGPRIEPAMGGGGGLRQASSDSGTPRSEASTSRLVIVQRLASPGISCLPSSVPALPFALVILNERLVVQPIDLDWHFRHVPAEYEQRRHRRIVEPAQQIALPLARQRRRWFE